MGGTTLEHFGDGVKSAKFNTFDPVPKVTIPKVTRFRSGYKRLVRYSKMKGRRP